MPEGTDNVAGLNSSLPTDDAPAGEGAAELRQLKAVLKNCFGGVDGPIYNEDGEKPTAADFTALFQAISELVDDSTGSPVPQMPYVGMIIMYAGDVNDLPAGWVFCDGRNGTPNLVGRFPLGWNDLSLTPTYDSASTGGALPSTWTVDSGGAHTHSVTPGDHTIGTSNLPAHTHELYRNERNDTGLGTELIGAGEAASYIGGSESNENYNIKRAPTTPSSIEPNVGRSGKGGLSASPDPLTHASTNTSSGGSHTHTISNATLPPWGCVFFLMYVGTA